MGELRIDVDGDDVAAAVRALTEADTSLPGAFQKTIRLKAAESARQASEKALQEPAFGAKHTGLRDEVASGVAVESTPGGAKISTSMPNTDEAIIPRGLDGGRGWRHPVFGHRSTWVRQHGAFSWFSETIAAGADDIEHGLGDDLDAAAERIAHT